MDSEKWANFLGSVFAVSPKVAGVLDSVHIEFMDDYLVIGVFSSFVEDTLLESKDLLAELLQEHFGIVNHEIRWIG